ncbi:MAG: hypothetical protein B6D44_00360 [Ignavibacteriales bacterium UTCHB2]|jgi:hypothetical protein|nr:MAG: hypothetical protein B6D44_00360 [Ignavibacteriales bacterium UTCHB2]
MKLILKNLLFKNNLFYSNYSKFKSHKLLNEYRKRREYYHNKCLKANISYNELDVIIEIRKRISKRGFTVMKKNVGEIHTYAFIPRHTWHNNLYDDLYELGKVSEFNYLEHGFTLNYNDTFYEKLKEMNKIFLDDLFRVHKNNPVDWVFVYASGFEIIPETISFIQNEIGVPVVNMCLDDKQSWELTYVGKHRGGQIDLASVFDISWTSARIACEWYLAENGRPIYMPEGCNIKVYKPILVSRDIDVSFIGISYGFRKRVVDNLLNNGINIHTFGPGWQTGFIDSHKSTEIFNRSKINLGMGGIGYSEMLTNVKTRDFEIPCTGGGVYITSFNPDLSLHFEMGKEIVCYRNNDEMLELIRYYLKHIDEADEISKKGFQRCLNEHRWLHRYIKILKILEILYE